MANLIDKVRQHYSDGFEYAKQTLQNTDQALTHLGQKTYRELSDFAEHPVGYSKEKASRLFRSDCQYKRQLNFSSGY